MRRFSSKSKAIFKASSQGSDGQPQHFKEQYESESESLISCKKCAGTCHCQKQLDPLQLEDEEETEEQQVEMID